MFNSYFGAIWHICFLNGCANPGFWYYHSMITQSIVKKSCLWHSQDERWILPRLLACTSHGLGIECLLYFGDNLSCYNGTLLCYTLFKPQCIKIDWEDLKQLWLLTNSKGGKVKLPQAHLIYTNHPDRLAAIVSPTSMGGCRSWLLVTGSLGHSAVGLKSVRTQGGSFTEEINTTLAIHPLHFNDGSLAKLYCLLP